ncbi:MAG: ArsR/SmtB family transcription factor [Streptosporangiaceae bacterium]
MALDVIFDALANEPRREILVRLSAGPMTTPQIGQGFGFTKQALSRHVAVLENAGLVRRMVRGRVHDLTLVQAPLAEVSGWLAEVERGWQASLDRLDMVLRSNRD